MVMQYAAGLATFAILALVMGTLVGWGLLPMLVAFGLGLVAYGLVDQRIKKGGGNGNAG